MGTLRGPRDEAAPVRHRARADLARIRRRTQDETVRASLFFVPMLFVVGAIVAAQLSLVVDRWITARGVVLPALLSATVDSARTVLSTVASATITFSGIAFAVSLLMIQLVSSQFSPRAVYGFYRDTFNKLVMGVAVGTFTYCLLVLRAIRRPFEEGGQAVIPYVSVFLGLAMGMVTILAVLAFINHSAHSMEATEIIRRITEDTRVQIAKMCPSPGTPDPSGERVGLFPEEPGFVIRADREGWVQYVDTRCLLSSVPERGVVRLDTGAGMFLIEGTPLCTLWPKPEDPIAATDTARAALRLGRTRTMEQDLALGFQQLADIALRALSPGINDPTTARETIVHIGSVLRDLLSRDLPPVALVDDQGRRLVRPHDLAHTDYLDLAVDEIRQAAANQPNVVVVLLDVLGMLITELKAAPERVQLVRTKVGDVLEACERSDLHPADLVRVRRIAELTRH